MTVRIKEIVVRYEDDGEVSPLSKEEHEQKYRPLRMVVHHHCSPPPNSPQTVETEEPSEAKEIRVDLNKLT